GGSVEGCEELRAKRLGPLRPRPQARFAGEGFLEAAEVREPDPDRPVDLGRTLVPRRERPPELFVDEAPSHELLVGDDVRKSERIRMEPERDERAPGAPEAALLDAAVDRRRLGRRGPVEPPRDRGGLERPVER